MNASIIVPNKHLINIDLSLASQSEVFTWAMRSKMDSGQFSVIDLTPYPTVVSVSMKNKNAVAYELTYKICIFYAA